MLNPLTLIAAASAAVIAEQPLLVYVMERAGDTERNPLAVLNGAKWYLMAKEREARS